MIARFSTELLPGLKGSVRSKDGLYCRLSLVRLLFGTVASLMLMLPGDFGSVYAKVGESKISGNWQSGLGEGMKDGSGISRFLEEQTEESAIIFIGDGEHSGKCMSYGPTGKLYLAASCSTTLYHWNEDDQIVHQNGRCLTWHTPSSNVRALYPCPPGDGSKWAYENGKLINFFDENNPLCLYKADTTNYLSMTSCETTGTEDFQFVDLNEFPTYSIERDGNVTVADSDGSNTVKRLEIKYLATTMGGDNTVNATILGTNCKSNISETLPLAYASEDGDKFDINVTYDPAVVENNTLIWAPTENTAGTVIGGTFGFCLRVELWHAGWSVYFLETKFSATVDKTKEFDTLKVTVDRTEATNETVTNVDYDAELFAFKCEVESLIADTDPVSQGSILGVCVNSVTSGIVVVGWQELTLKNSEDLEFPAIVDGSVSTGLENLVTERCFEEDATGIKWCTAQVQLVSGFFTRDGSFNATGIVVLGLSDSVRRQLEKATDTYSQRTLEEEGGSGTFDISIEMDSPVSAASSMNAPHFQIITFALVSLLAFALY